MDPQRNAPDQADRGWYDRRHGEPEWEGYRLPGPRGAGESLEADPLAGGTHAASPPAYDQQSAYNPLAAPAIEVPAYGPPPSSYSTQQVPAPAAYEVPPAAQQVPPPPPPGYKSFEEPTGAVPPIAPRPEAGPIETQRFHTEAIDRSALHRPSMPPADGVYRTKRPAAGIVFAVLAAIFEIPALRLLADAAVGGPVVASGVVAGTFLVAGLPLVAFGLYALVTGANRLPSDGAGPQAWLRPPTAYLPIGLVLLVAAALAT
ncbi:hypothetical protein [Phytohabitans houttuyneae]|uniref:Uncharacterized protein n=1 Tax=Phytohabitans houttuyneae TaxID=1076126 RepID=A0A6V8K7X6_9ACTN|nr:hypothetical protein [Phytohabitans houttuyneae]GFJ78096.1 hypothetical protein Phou_022760 [Phytohabitans houttuyneae]